MATRVNRLKHLVQRVSCHLESHPDILKCPETSPDFASLQGALREIPPPCQEALCAQSRAQLERKVILTPHAYSPSGYLESPAFRRHRYIFSCNHLFRKNSAQFPKLTRHQLCSKTLKDAHQRIEREIRDYQFFTVRQFTEERNCGFLREGHLIEDWSERFLDNLQLVNEWNANMPTLLHFCESCCESPYIAALFTLRDMLTLTHKAIGPECKLEDMAQMSLLFPILGVDFKSYFIQTKFMCAKMLAKLAAQKQEIQKIQFNLRFQSASDKVLFILPAVRNDLRDRVAHEMVFHCAQTENNQARFEWYLRNLLGRDFQELQQEFQAIKAQPIYEDLTPVKFKGQRPIAREKRKHVYKRKVRHQSRGRPKQFTKVLRDGESALYIFKKRVRMAAAALRRAHNLPQQTQEEKSKPIKLLDESQQGTQKQTANDIIRKIAVQRVINKCIKEGEKAQRQSKITDKSQQLSKISKKLDEMAAESRMFNRFDQTIMITEAKKLSEKEKKELDANITGLSKVARVRVKTNTKPVEVKSGNNSILSKP